MTRSRLVPGLLLALLPCPAAAQEWNSPDVAALIERAVARRARAQADSGLRNYRAIAHGFVFFLAQLGEGFREAPRLVKSDQLALEVYWQAPGASKQVIVGRRDRRDLPTDMQYHRDHLGIIQNNFGDSIRLGEGDEVRDVPHPLAAAGPALYDYALADSLTIELPDRAIRVYQVPVRPRAFGEPRVAGTLYLDVEQAELVRFQFNFTPAAYRDATVEDIVVVLDNALWFGRYWLPRRQEIEIRRRSSWLDLPTRGIIRGRWEIGRYQFNLPLPPGLFLVNEPEIVLAPPAVRDTFRWDASLEDAIRPALGPVQAADLESVRSVIGRAVANRALTGLARSRPSFGALSDVLHVNRVEGLSPGFGWVFRPGDRRLALTAWTSYGTADRRLKGRLWASGTAGAWTVTAGGAREVRDASDTPVISPLLNSLLSQEGGRDFGDYTLLDRAALTVARSFGGRTTARAEVAAERARGVPAAARPASGQYRPNLVGGSPARLVSRLEIQRRPLGLAAPLDAGLRMAVEHGYRPGEAYLRLRGELELALRAGPTEIRLRGSGGWGSTRLPAHRSFALGGRGTLPGEPFRAWGGRQAVAGFGEWRLRVPFPAVRLGPFGDTGAHAVLAPFLAGGWARGAVAGVSWATTPQARWVGGVAAELLHGLVRVEVGTSLHGAGTTVTVDVRRDLWPIL